MSGGSSIPTRDARLDALRGLAIGLVVAGHALVRATAVHPQAAAGLVSVSGVGWIARATVASPLVDIIYSFHIPLFAFVSGVVTCGSRHGYGAAFLRRRFAGLMVPYLAWLLIGWVSAGERSLGGVARFIVAGATDPQSPGALWFLYALFMSAVVLAGVKRVSTSEGALIVSAVLVGFAGVVPAGAYEHTLGLSDVAWVYPFFVAGLLFAPRRVWFEERSWWVMPTAAVLWVSTLPLVAPILLPGPRWWFGPAVAWLAPLGTIRPEWIVKAVWAIVRIAGALAASVTVYLAYGRLRGAVLDAQAWVGRRSIGVYALQAAFLVPLAPVWGWPRVAMLFAAAMAGSILATLLLERFAWTRIVLLGRPE